MSIYHFRKVQKITFLIICLTFFNSSLLLAGTGTFLSTTTGGNINYITSESATPLKDANGNYLTIVYLENLNFNKLGQNTNAEDVSWFLSKGYRVIELDYAKNVNAISPNINADIIKINKAINSGSFCGLTNCSLYRTWVLFEGYRIAKDVSYFKDNPTVYNYPTAYTVGDSMYMDIIYPANSVVAVPVVLSFSYSNSTFTTPHQRMNLGNTLASFSDSFLEGAPAKGIAWAIADHPKYCDWGQGKPTGGANKAYGAYETNPDAAQKVKSAIRTLRAKGSGLNLSGEIGIYGFSRGSTAGSMAIGDSTVTNFENAGLYIGTSDDVQVAGLGSGVFDYTLIFNPEESDVGNLRTNCPLAWGALSSNYALWKTQGSSYLVSTSATAPVIFFYNTDDALYYQDQISKLKTKLTNLGVPTAAITNYGTGHSVPQTDVPLTQMYNFFSQYLTPPSIYTGLEAVNLESENPFTLSVNYENNKLNLRYKLNNAGKTCIIIYNLSGIELYKSEKTNDIETQSITLDLSDLNLGSGMYFVKVYSSGLQSTKRFVK